MSTAAAPTPISTPEPDSSVVKRVVELTTRVATSWFGAVAGYFAAILSAVLAYQKLQEEGVKQFV